MKIPELSPVWTWRMLGVLRIMTALLFMEHGTQKLLGFPRARRRRGDHRNLPIRLAPGETPSTTSSYMETTALCAALLAPFPICRSNIPNQTLR
jgi:uncharacterized membrane protein YphA (DoxX/SURF4 family)